MYEDNQATLVLARDPQYHARSKHFDVQNHFIRERVEDGTIEPIYCPTEDQIADIFTKPLARPKHEKFTRALGLLPA
jgi:KUP system potassium uptake protein